MRSNTIYKFILVLILLSTIIFFAMYLFKSMSLQIEKTKVQTHNDEQAKNLEFGNRLQQNLNVLNDQVAVIENSFILSTQVLDFIRSLEDIAKEKGLKISIEKVERGEKQKITSEAKSISTANFMIQVAGSYDQTILFAEEILKNDKKLSLSQIQTYRTVTEGAVMYTARMTLQGIILDYE